MKHEFKNIKNTFINFGEVFPFAKNDWRSHESSFELKNALKNKISKLKYIKRQVSIQKKTSVQKPRYACRWVQPPLKWKIGKKLL